MPMALTALTFCAIRTGMVAQGSPGLTMKTIINALEKRFPGNAAHDEAAA